MDMYEDKEFGEYCDRARMTIGSTYGLVAWEAWKASRSAIIVESPEDFTSGGNPNARILIAHHREIVSRWINAIESHGLKVKL